MNRSFFLVTAAAAIVIAGPAAAQSDASASVPGPYGVVRAGVVIDTDARLRDHRAAVPSTFQRDTDFKPGFTGSIGGGYDFGGFRLEGTVGYTGASIDRKKAATGGFAAGGRTRNLDLDLAGYVDIPTGSVVTPYVGGGIGASRVDARLSRLRGTPATGSRFADKDWGLRWHLDAGIGIKAAARTTVDLGARYTRISQLDFDGATGNATDRFRMRQGSWSTTIGLRQAF